MKNSFGKLFKVHSFGESHGVALGCVIDGCPSGLDFSEDILRDNLLRRRPGRHANSQNINSDRNEEDAFEILSGVYQSKTTGNPITIITRNVDQRSQDYDNIQSNPRPGHADDVWKNKFQHIDHRGGGRSSGRETVSRVMAGSVAEMLNLKLASQMKVKVFVNQIHNICLEENEKKEIVNQVEFKKYLNQFPTKMPNPHKDKALQELLLKAKTEGKSYGGNMEIWIENPPAHLGQAVFHKLKNSFANAYLSIGACNSFELGDANFVNSQEGSTIHTLSPEGEANIYGGIRGGFSTGHTIKMKIGFKPTSSVMDVAKKGRHDPCILPRALVVVEAMTHLVLADHLLWQRLDNI